MIIDITRRLVSGFPAWPGDEPFEARTGATEGGGGWVRVSRLSMSAHAGTHLDAPMHVLETGESLDAIALESLIGPATVVHIPVARPIEPEDLPADLLDPGRGEAARRILFRTESAETLPLLPSAFATISLRTAEVLSRSEVRLAGIDTPSVDPADDDRLSAHRALAAAGIAILEWLDLRDAAPGVHELVALPLRLSGLEASPVRAVLVG
jgi:arylformamidase